MLDGIAQLRPGTVQVWRLQLGSEANAPLLDRAHAALSVDECVRAARLRAGLPREEFMAARGLLRLLLGQANGLNPAELRFKTGAHGKPALVDATIDFNVAHARGCILVALSLDGAVGIDVEPIDREVEVAELAQAHFHPEEISRILAEDGEEQRVALFFRCWTRKEAVVKADGRGLRLPLAQVCVLGVSPLTDVAIEVRLSDADTWWVRDLHCFGAYTCAIACPKWEIAVQTLDLNSSFDAATHLSAIE